MRVVLSVFSNVLCCFARGLARLGQGYLVNMKIRFGLMVFGKHLGTHLSRLLNSPFCQQHHHLTKLSIRALRDEEGCRQMRAQLALYGLDLDLEATGTDPFSLRYGSAPRRVRRYRW